MKKTVFVKDLVEGGVQSPFLVMNSSIVTGKNGKPYMNLVLGDRTGQIEARIFGEVENFGNQAVSGAFIGIEGRCQEYQGRKQVVIQDLKVLREDEIEPKDFLSESEVNGDELYEKLLGIIASMKDPHYKALAESVLKDDEEIVDRLKRAPAAKSVHHAYRGGLLEHIISVSEILDGLAHHYDPHLDRDLLLLGGFFHDIGKIWELSYDRPVTDYTTEGRLVGHLVMGVELVERKIRALSISFPEDKVLLVKHLILSHHGELEYGSPKRPKCLEALVVHMVDNLDSKVNAIRLFMEADQNQGDWTSLNRMHERYFYKGTLFRDRNSSEAND